MDLQPLFSNQLGIVLLKEKILRCARLSSRTSLKTGWSWTDINTINSPYCPQWSRMDIYINGKFNKGKFCIGCSKLTWIMLLLIYHKNINCFLLSCLSLFTYLKFLFLMASHKQQKKVYRFISRIILLPVWPQQYTFVYSFVSSIFFDPFLIIFAYHDQQSVMQIY